MTESVRTTGRSETAGEDLLLDRYLPRFDVTLVEHVVADADIAETWRAVRDLDLMRVHSPLMDAAMFARGLPAAIVRRMKGAGPAEPPAELKLVGGPGLPGWLPLGEVPGRQVALGAVGRFWQPDIRWYDVSGMTPDAFAAFAEPGWGRIAAGITLRPYGSFRTLVSYEARTATCDAVSARRFARYWRLVRPFVRTVMTATLRTIRNDAESLTDRRVPPLHRWSRWLYRGGRPRRLARVLNRGDAAAFAAGVVPHRGVTLEVPGRSSGRVLPVPLVVADLAGERYLVAMLGERTQWVRNLRAAGGHAVLRHGRREEVRLEEVPVELRAPVLRRYLACAPGARAHIPVDRNAPVGEFARIAADYPVFRVAG